MVYARDTHTPLQLEYRTWDTSVLGSLALLFGEAAATITGGLLVTQFYAPRESMLTTPRRGLTVRRRATYHSPTNGYDSCTDSRGQPG